MGHIIISLLSLVMMFFQPSAQKATSTENFRIRYDKSITLKNIRSVGTMLEEEYARQQKLLGISFSRKMNVYVYNSELRFKSESKSLAFDDGDVKNGKMYFSYSVLQKKREAQSHIIARVITKAILSELVLCPPWLHDAYALYAGGEVDRFGEPARVNIASFADLFEEYNRAERPRDVKEVYAKLGATINFLVDKYGEKKVRELFVQCKTGRDIESIFEAVFGEKIQDIEQAWVSALRSTLRR